MSEGRELELNNTVTRLTAKLLDSLLNDIPIRCLDGPICRLQFTVLICGRGGAGIDFGARRPVVECKNHNPGTKNRVEKHEARPLSHKNQVTKFDRRK